MAEQIKRGLEIHAPHIPQFATQIDRITKEIEDDCSDMEFRDNDHATAEVQAVLEYKLKAELYWPTVDAQIKLALAGVFISGPEGCLYDIKRITDRYFTWRAINGLIERTDDNFDATVGGREPE